MKTNLVVFLMAAILAGTAACGGREVEVTRLSTSPSTDTRTTQTVSAVPVIVSGAITAVDATARTLVVSGTTVSVPATAAIDGGRDGAVTLADLKIGWGVTIRATRSGSTVTAIAISVVDRGVPHVELDGRIDGLTGTCPAVTFTVGSAIVTTSRSTVFAETACAQLATGESVVVDGTLQADNSVSAGRVSARNNR